MQATAKKATLARREPTQRRALQTVQAVLDAVVRVLELHGVDGVTTNRIAEVAGVSIGSVYQYFPDKRAIYRALHDRHVEQISRVIDATLVEQASSSLDDFVRALITALVRAHMQDPELHEIMATIPHRADGVHSLEMRLRNTFKLAITSRARGAVAARDLDRMLFVLPHVVDALVHGVAHRRPARLSVGAATDDAIKAVIACMQA
jgi:AcrR family transcriptional regulator